MREAASVDEHLRPFAPPEQAPEMEHVAIRPGNSRRTFERNLATNETVYTVFTDEAELEGAAVAHISAIELDLASSIRRCYRITERDPESASACIEQRTLFRRSSWRIRIETKIELTATRDTFRVVGTLLAFEGDVCIFKREWDERIPRDLL